MGLFALMGLKVGTRSAKIGAWAVIYEQKINVHTNLAAYWCFRLRGRGPPVTYATHVMQGPCASYRKA